LEAQNTSMIDGASHVIKHDSSQPHLITD